MSFRENIALNINTRLKELKITQKTFAEKLNIKQATVSKWVSGTQVPDIDLIPAVCKELGLTLNQLFGIDDANSDTLKAMKLYKAYIEHPDVRGSVDILLELKKDR